MKRITCITAMILMAMTIVACTKTQTTPTSVPTNGATPTATNAPATPTSTPTEVPATPTSTPTPTVTPTSEPVLTGALTGYKTTDQDSVYVNKTLNLTGAIKLAKFKDCIVALTETSKGTSNYEYSLVTYSTSDYKKIDSVTLDIIDPVSFSLGDYNFVRCKNNVLILEQADQGTRFHSYNPETKKLSLVKSDKCYSFNHDSYYDEENDRVILISREDIELKRTYEFDSFDLKTGEIKKVSDIKLALETGSYLTCFGVTDTNKYLLKVNTVENDDDVSVLWSTKNYIAELSSGETAEIALPSAIGELDNGNAKVFGFSEPNGKRLVIFDTHDWKLYVYNTDTKNRVDIQTSDPYESQSLFNYGVDRWIKDSYTVDWENNILITVVASTLRSYSLETGALISTVKITFNERCNPLLDTENHLLYVSSGANGVFAWDYLK